MMQKGQIPTMPDEFSLESVVEAIQRYRNKGKTIVFSNGVFDILHRGHVEYLSKAKLLGDILIVGVNDDASVRRLKGEKRPIVPERDRAYIIANLKAVDHVVLFGEETPVQLIDAIVPDILVKGADYQLHEIVGRETVVAAGGRVERISLTPNRATTDLISVILNRYGV